MRFDRTNLVPFTLTIAPTTERLEVNGGGGNDTMAGEAGIAVLGVALTLNGGTGDDTITGADSADLITGGDDNDVLAGAGGDDRIVGNRGSDTQTGGDGDDTTVWNNGDGTDKSDGDGGFDVQEVNGATNAGDAFTVRPDGARTRFDRTNLVAFSIDIASEALDLNALGGNDVATVADGTPLVVDVDGGSGDDVLTGSAGTETMRGGSGNDTLTGGGGVDAIDGEDGADAIAARDGAPDIVRCGAGADSATLDAATLDAAVDCEAAARPAAGPAAAAVRIVTRSGRLAKGRLGVRLACPAGATQCRGRLTLYTRKTIRIGRVRAVLQLGSATYRIDAGKRRTVRVKLPSRARRLRAASGRSPCAPWRRPPPAAGRRSRPRARSRCACADARSEQPRGGPWRRTAPATLRAQSWWWWPPPCRPPSCERISPPGRPVVWTFTYVAPARSAATNSSNSPAAMPASAAPAPTSSGRIVPLTVPPPAGQACVPAGPLPRFEHRKTTIGPLFVRFSKWMCACVASDSSSPKLSR